MSGDHGKWPSAQFVATLRPKLRSSALSTELRTSKSLSRSSGRMYPARAACTAAGSSAARPGLRSESITTLMRSSPLIWTLRVPPATVMLPGPDSPRAGWPRRRRRRVRRASLPCSGPGRRRCSACRPSPAGRAGRRDRGTSAGRPSRAGSGRRCQGAQRVGERQLRPVRDTEETDLPEPERLAHGLDVLGVVTRGIED